MSKLTTRIALSVLISLVVIAGIYTTVLGAPSILLENRAGNHLVSGARVNLDHYREANPAPAGLQSDLQSGQGHDCHSDSQASPDD
ncbi:MAG: hypothetical protein ACM3PS_16610 [Syntrophothermus sp.]